MAPWPELINRIARRFRDASRTSQVLWIVAASMLIGGLAWSWQSAQRVEHVELFGGRTFTSRELTAIESAFAKAGLNGYQFDDRRVRVPHESRSAYIASLVDSNALPVDLSLSDQPSTANLLETASQRESRTARERQRELSAIIRSLNGIDDAAVHLDEEVQSGLHRRREVTAIVAVRPTPGHTLDADRIHHIQEIVAGAKIGLSSEDVTVANLDAGTSHRSESDRTMIPLADSHRRYEQYLSDQVTSVLGFIPNVHVATTAEMRWSNTSEGPRDEGLRAAARSVESLIPRGVSISVAIPTTYLLATWQHGQSTGDKSPVPTLAELSATEAETQQQIIEAVRGVLPPRLVDKPGATKITVTSFEPSAPDARLATSPDDKSPLPPQAWISAIIGLLAIAALAASLFWGAAGVPKGKAIEQEPHVLSADTGVADEEDSIAIDSTARPDRTELATDDNSDGIQQSLAAAVQDDPQAAAEVLRRWTDTAA